MISALLVLLYFIRTIGNGELDTHTHTGGEGALESETESWLRTLYAQGHDRELNSPSPQQEL